MKNYNLALIISALLTISIYAEEVEEVVVTASLTNQTVSDLKDPLHVVDGDDVDAGGVQSLGDTLDELLGVHSADFGAAVGQPVVRGMSGSRVRVLENGVVVRDVAALGPDHINDVNLLNTQQIEVVKGPSSLLYANGGAGGVINIVDNSIAAKAENVWLHLNWSGKDSTIAITDDGCGMTENQLREAMRMGSKSPSEERDPKDLGRFGLGLKTCLLYTSPSPRD